mmetsp:Transcript_132720/g.233827  ORF Transcript_132720/g.233827 Transcript_132720/m.233827 type:complete len:386 (+) Transcript_132720:157-1314(+)
MSDDKEAADPLGLFAEDDREEENGKGHDNSADAGKPNKGDHRGSRRSRSSSSSSPERKNDKRQQASSASRSRSSGDNGDSSLDARIRRLRKKITDFIDNNNLDNRVSGIMQNMHPSDVVKVMEVPFPDECRNPSGFVVSQIRKAERDAGRPKDYRWDEKDWNETAKDKAGPGGRAASRRDHPRDGGKDRDRSDRDRDRKRSRRRRRSRSRGRRRDRRRRGGSKRSRRRTGRRRKKRRKPSYSESSSRSKSGSAESYSEGSDEGSEDSGSGSRSRSDSRGKSRSRSRPKRRGGGKSRDRSRSRSQRRGGGKSRGQFGSGDHRQDLEGFISKNQLEARVAHALRSMSEGDQKKVMGTDGGENSYMLIDRVKNPNGVVMSRIRKLERR